jgi:hypothetical protein
MLNQQIQCVMRSKPIAYHLMGAQTFKGHNLAQKSEF